MITRPLACKWEARTKVQDQTLAGQTGRSDNRDKRRQGALAIVLSNLAPVRVRSESGLA